MAKTKIGKQKVDGGSFNQTVTPIEDEFQLVTMLKIAFEGMDIGAYVLRRKEQDLKIQFGFSCQGIHTTLRTEEINPVFDAVELGLKDFPDKEVLTIHLGSFTRDAARQQELSELLDGTTSSELRFLMMGEKARVRELTQAGVRKEKFLHLYGSYTVESGADATTERIESILYRLEKFWRTFTGEFDEVQLRSLETLIRNAYTEGYQTWAQLLGSDTPVG